MAPPATHLAALRPRVVVAFLGTWVLALLAANLVPVMIGALVADLGFEISAAAGLATAMSLGTAAGIFATNAVVARLSRPLLARIGLTVLAIGFGLGALTMTVPAVSFGVVLGGVGAGITVAAATAASAATEDPDKTSSVVMIVNRLFAALLLAVIPFLGQNLQLILAIPAVLGLAGLLAAGGLPSLQAEGTNAAPIGAASGRAPRIGGLAVLLALVFGLWSMTEDMVYAMTELLATTHVGLAVEQSSLLISLNIVGGLAGALIAPLALRTIGRSWSIFGIVVISSVSKFLIVTTTVPGVYAASIIVWGVMYGAVLSLVFALAARMDVSGRSVALVSGVYITGIALGPVVGGVLIENVGLLEFGLLAGIPSLVFGVALLVVSRRSGVTEHGGAQSGPAVEPAAIVEVAK
jgi:DHA1 family inner membrane transport protein